ncbi:MAG: cytochrome c oxidase assembly protein [Hyphomonadaceae bacterium]
MTPKARMLAITLFGAAIGMVALSFAAEPLYSTFCRVTGFGGTTQVATTAPTAATDRPIRVRFDANVASGLPLKFRAEQPYVDGTLGQTLMAFYEVTNTSDTPVRVVAGYNVAPHNVGVYFSKIQCFCFTERTLPPGRSERLPVVFFVDPKLQEDRHTRSVDTITLSYTYYRAGDQPTAQLEATTTLN